MLGLELSNIKCKNEYVARFYLYNPYEYEKDYRWPNERPEYPEKLYMKVELKRDGSLWISWHELPFKNAYQTYIDNLETEYNYSLEEYPQSYIDKIVEEYEFFELVEKVLYKKP